VINAYFSQIINFDYIYIYCIKYTMNDEQAVAEGQDVGSRISPSGHLIVRY